MILDLNAEDDSIKNNLRSAEITEDKTELTRQTTEYRIVTHERIDEFCLWLYECEKSRYTVERYRHCLEQFSEYMEEREVRKQDVICWKEHLKEKQAPSTVNGALAALNRFFEYYRWTDCRVHFLKMKRSLFMPEKKEISKSEYKKLVEEAYRNDNERLALILQTLCSTGIRVSELGSITVQAIERGEALIENKGKIREILLPGKLCRMLKDYAGKKHIETGCIFITRSGKPVDRSNIWREMKQLCVLSSINPDKVFPHNFRHLFARTYYEQEKNLVRLADVLGHSSVNTTRIYTMESGKQYLKQLEQMDLLVDYNRIPLL